MGDDHGVGTLAGDVVDRCLQVCQVLRVEGGGQGVVSQTFHQDIDTESVHSLADEGINSGKSGPDIVSVLGTGKLGLAKLRTGLVDTEELEVGSTLLFLLHWRSQREGGRTGNKKSGKTHDEGKE